MKAVCVTGATGFVGCPLVERLFSQGVTEIRVLSRSSPTRISSPSHQKVRTFVWQPDREVAPLDALHGCDTIFHLAGESVAGGRWTQARKTRILESRVLGTRNLVEGIRKLGAQGLPAPTLISTSAIGFYGDRGDELLHESSSSGAGFLASVCQGWEAEAQQTPGRCVILRVGIVLEKGGGALEKMLPPFKLGLGGPLGSGQQWMSWIHREDLVSLYCFAADTPALQGILNAVAPHPVKNVEFTRTLGRVLRRSAALRAPSFALKLALGEMSTVLLASQRVIPERALKEGFQFAHPSLENTLRDVCA